MTYKAIFSDVDGTLINSKFEITKPTRLAIEEQVDKGVAFVTVSARSGPSMLPIRREFSFPAYQIIFSGALAQDPQGNDLLNCPLTTDQVERVYQTLGAKYPSIICTCYTKEDWYVPQIDEKWIPFEANCTEITPIVRHPQADETVYKFLCIGDEDETDIAVKDLQGLLPDLTVYKSSRNYIEILSGKASKSTAIAFLLQQWGMDTTECIAFGDSYNDIDMLHYVGFSVAMGNAPAEVKQAADVCTLSNDEDGLCKAIKQYMR